MGKRLAIRGHSTRGKEVIEILEMMGGNNRWSTNGRLPNLYYFISNECIIYSSQIEKDVVIFTLEEFLEKYPFKVGDFVRIPEYESEVRILKMKWCPVSKHIEYLVCPNDEDEWFTADELLEDNDNPNETTDCKKCGLHFGSVKCFDKDCPNNTPKAVDKEAIFKIGHVMVLDKVDDKLECEIIDGYEFDKVENGKIILKPIKPKYPITYEECREILEEQADVTYGYNRDILHNLQVLLVCRDAYWKIAGEQMGLDKPWKPDWNDSTPKYTIVVIGNDLVKHYTFAQNFILAFPTAEMRDAFYENFKDLIDQCKKLL